VSDQQQKKDIGGLWKQTSKNGMPYLSGTVNGQRIVVFPNSKKQDGEKTPDYRIYEQTPWLSSYLGTVMGQQAAPAAAPSGRRAVTSDDIPF